MTEVGQLGQGVITPAAMQERLEQLRAASGSLALAASKYVPPPTERERWAMYSETLATWLGRFEAYKPSWADRMWGETANQIESYALQLEQLREGFQRFPGHSDPGPSPGTSASLGDLLRGATRGLGTGVGFAVGLAALGVGAFWLLTRNKSQ